MLSLFANPLHTRILRAHAAGPRRLAELREELHPAPEATVRAAANCLVDSGALQKHADGAGRRTVAMSLTAAGEEMLVVAADLEVWLAACPEGPIALEGEHAKVAVRALTDGWSSTLIRELADGPRTATELSMRIPQLTQSALERRLAWMRQTGQIEPMQKRGRATPYAPTDWLRRSLAPLCSAGRCEARHLDDSPPITNVEVETAFLLTVPLLRLADGVNGDCLLAARTEDGGHNGDMPVAGVDVDVRDGKPTARRTELSHDPSNWAMGPAQAWIDVVIDGRVDGLRVGGSDPQLALDLVSALHHALYIDR